MFTWDARSITAIPIKSIIFAQYFYAFLRLVIGQGVGQGMFPTSVSVKEIFQRVTDAWSLKFVRQRENCESQ